MKKFLLTSIIIGFLASCSTTKIYPRIECHVCLSKSDGILLLPLNWQESFRQLSISEQNELERIILETFREEGFTQVTLYDQMDYELLKTGIKDVDDPIKRANIDLELGIPYLLGLSLGELRWTGDWQNLEPSNPDSGTYWESDTRVSNSLRIALMETATGEVISDYAVTTTIDGLPIPLGEGESASLNFASLAQAVRINVRKGIKNFVADCIC
ncbi:hypothetical protein ACFOSV_02730 [Algoriphagus namhaensis]|uniref:DUF4136 domain-containing protein n=1 Tax=Algoriphagus namhaensis TaxID=915353 RepID=A0ABV8AN66_9BACT